MDGMPKGLKITNHTGQVLYDSAWIAGVEYDQDELKIKIMKRKKMKMMTVAILMTAMTMMMMTMISMTKWIQMKFLH
jgi:hypothetical protein